MEQRDFNNLEANAPTEPVNPAPTVGTPLSTNPERVVITAGTNPSAINKRDRFVAANNTARFYTPSNLVLQPTVDLASFPPPNQYLTSTYPTNYEQNYYSETYYPQNHNRAVARRKVPGWVVAIFTALLTMALAIGLPLAARQGADWFTPPTQNQPQLPAGQAQQQNNYRTSDVPAELSKGVVLITTKTTSGGASGSGMVLTSSGRVLTNYHVVKGSTSINVEIADTGKIYAAQLSGYDAEADVALLQLDNAQGLETVTIATESPAVGDGVRVVGNSNGQGYLDVAGGLITQLSASVTINDDSSRNGSTKMRGVIETSASAVSGDSGGPMFNDTGEVIGITTAGDASPSFNQSNSTSYGVPINMALEVVETILSGDESGTVTIGPKSWLGITGRNSTTGVQGRALIGVEIIEVVDGSPAQIAGLSSGSILTELDGINIEDLYTLSVALSHLEPGETVGITWWNGSVQNTGTVVLGESPIN